MKGREVIKKRLYALVVVCDGKILVETYNIVGHDGE
jgi:hypothetical protein